MRKIFFSLFKLGRLRRIICKKIEEKSFFTFYDREKLFLNLIKPLTARWRLIVVTCNGIAVSWYFICARELFSIWLFHRKLHVAFVLVKFSLCQEELEPAGILLAYLPILARKSRRGENLVEPAGSASNKIFGSILNWATMGHIIWN